jgi:HPt (histidine-containing phosphotransfer) domain-containing protein
MTGKSNHRSRPSFSPSEIEATLSELRVMFCESAREDLRQFDTLIGEIEKESGVERPVRDIVQIWHRLKGSGGTIGLSCVSFIAREMEVILKRRIPPDDGDLPRMIDLQRAAQELLTNVLEEASAHVLPDSRQRQIEDEFLTSAKRLGLFADSG